MQKLWNFCFIHESSKAQGERYDFSHATLAFQHYFQSPKSNPNNDQILQQLSRRQLTEKICPNSQSSKLKCFNPMRLSSSRDALSIRYHDVAGRISFKNSRKISIHQFHFLSFRSFAQLTGLGGGGGGWSDWFLRSELVAYLGLGDASTALWMSREKFSLPTTEERYDERCILETEVRIDFCSF